MDGPGPRRCANTAAARLVPGWGEAMSLGYRSCVRTKLRHAVALRFSGPAPPVGPGGGAGAGGRSAARFWGRSLVHDCAADLCPSPRFPTYEQPWCAATRSTKPFGIIPVLTCGFLTSLPGAGRLSGDAGEWG